MIGMLSLSTINMKDKVKKNKVITIVSAIAIVLIQGLRHYAVGTDIATYLYGLRLSEHMNFWAGETLYNFGLGYSIYSKIFAMLNVTDTQYLFIVAITIILPITYVLIKNSRMPALSILMYICLGFFMFTFSGVRQSIALAITFYSFRFIKDRKLLMFLLCLGLATLFHKSAMVFGVAYFLYPLKFKIKHLIFNFCFLIFILIFKEQIFNYLFWFYKRSNVVIENTGAYKMFLFMILIYISTFFLWRNDSDNLLLNAYRNYLFIAIIIQSFASMSNTIMRVGYYYFIFIILLIPEIIMKHKDYRVRFLMTSIVVLLSLLFFQFQVGSGYLNVNPYKFFWE